MSNYTTAVVFYDPTDYLENAKCQEIACPEITKEVIQSISGGQG
jgi:hypothetical protein